MLNADCGRAPGELSRPSPSVYAKRRGSAFPPRLSLAKSWDSMVNMSSRRASWRSGRVLWIPLLSLGLSGVVLLSQTPASAQSADDQAAADALFDAARTLMDRGDYDTACPKFRDSYELDPGVGTLLNLALCYKKAGRTASAWSVFREAAGAARQLGQADRETLARDEANALESQLVRLQIDVSPEAAAISGIEVKRGDQVVRDSLWGVGIPVDPGEITIVASAPGYQSRSTVVKAAGKGRTVTFRVEALTPNEGGATVTTPPAEEPKQEVKKETPPPEDKPKTAEEAPQKKGSPWPWVLGGVGVAAAGTGTVFAFLAKSDYDASLEICSDFPDGPCSQDDVDDQEALQRSTRSKAMVAYIGWGVGGAALVGAGILFLTQSKEDTTGVSWQPLIGHDTWGLSASGKF